MNEIKPNRTVNAPAPTFCSDDVDTRKLLRKTTVKNKVTQTMFFIISIETFNF